MVLTISIVVIIMVVLFAARPLGVCECDDRYGDLRYPDCLCEVCRLLRPPPKQKPPND